MTCWWNSFDRTCPTTTMRTMQSTTTRSHSRTVHDTPQRWTLTSDSGGIDESFVQLEGWKLQPQSRRWLARHFRQPSIPVPMSVSLSTSIRQVFYTWMRGKDTWELAQHIAVWRRTSSRRLTWLSADIPCWWCVPLPSFALRCDQMRDSSRPADKSAWAQTAGSQRRWWSRVAVTRTFPVSLAALTCRRRLALINNLAPLA